MTMSTTHAVHGDPRLSRFEPLAAIACAIESIGVIPTPPAINTTGCDLDISR